MLRGSLTTADWIIVLFALLLAFNGARQGFILGVLQLAGFGAAAFLGARLGSAILRALNDALPPSGFILNALARFDPLPRINGPSTQGVPAPTAKIARVHAVRAAEASVVRVLGTACGLGVEGSGWVAGNGLVVTNAHVVAGESDTTVQLGGHSPSLNADVVHFDPRNDVAVLRVDAIHGGGLRLAATVKS